MCQCSWSTLLSPIQHLHPTRAPTPTQPVSNKPVSLPLISTLPEKVEPEPEQQELEPEQYESDDERDKLNHQFKSCIRDFNKNVLKWLTGYMTKKYKPSYM